jgi:sterol desaturase/sphingolipid hydroxylase (fatty acid hydroxylase superfamily)
MITNIASIPVFDRLQKFFHWLWHADIHFKKTGKHRIAFLLCFGLAMVLWLLTHGGIQYIPTFFSAEKLRVFYGVAEVPVSGMAAPIAYLLALSCVVRLVFETCIGIADLVFYKKIRGRPFDYESMFNVAIVNVIFTFTILTTFANPYAQEWLAHYDRLIAGVPTLINLGGPIALLLACLIGDFCFYWSHRLCHNIRFFWNVGHVNHHRNRNLTQLTFSIDPHSFLVNANGGQVFALLMLPLLMKIFSLSIIDAGWAFFVLAFFDILAGPSHSTTLYYLELRFKLLRAVRYVFVTAAVHTVHHSREARHDLAGGCNFGARFTLWDRLFGTYAEPPAYITESGLFSDTTDFCINPIRYIAHPPLRMFKELRLNKLRTWPSIIFGNTSYEPPVKSGTEV